MVGHTAPNIILIEDRQTTAAVSIGKGSASQIRLPIEISIS